MKKNTNNLKINWVVIIALATAMTIVSCQNEKMVKQQEEKYRMERFQQNEEDWEEILRIANEHNALNTIVPEETNDKEYNYSK